MVQKVKTKSDYTKTIKISKENQIDFDLIMAYEQQLFNIPLAGDILDDLAMAFREIISKVG